MVCEAKSLDGPRRAFLEKEAYRQTVDARDFIAIVEELEKLKKEIEELRAQLPKEAEPVPTLPVRSVVTAATITRSPLRISEALAGSVAFQVH